MNAQLVDQRVDVVLADGEPVLKVTEDTGTPTATGDQDLSARITVRIPESIKALVEDAADGSGASVNQFVVDALSRKVSQKQGKRRTQRGTIDL